MPNRIGVANVVQVVQVDQDALKQLAAKFQPSEGLKALVYFNDGDLRTLTKEDKGILVNAVSAVRELPRVAIVSSTLAG